MQRSSLPGKSLSSPRPAHATAGPSSGVRDMLAAPVRLSGPAGFRRIWRQGQDLPTTVAAMEGLGYGCPDSGLIFATEASLWTVTLPILTLRDRRPEKALPARPVRRPAARGQRGQRIRCRLRYLRHADPRRTPWRRLDLERPQDLDHRRPGRRPLRLLRHHRPLQGHPRGSRRSWSNATHRGSTWSARSTSWGCGRSPMAELVFENCGLPADAMLGREGRGAPIFNAALELERGAILAESPGHDAATARPVHPSTHAPASSSASRSASSNRSRTGSSR